MDYLRNLFASGSEVLTGPLLLVGSAILRYRLRIWPTRLLLVGSLAYLAFGIFFFTLERLGEIGDPAWLVWLFGTFLLVLMSCFPIGFIGYAYALKKNRKPIVR